MERHRILGDQVTLYQRSIGGAWHCSTYLKGKEWRKSTRQKSLSRAKDEATDWFNQLNSQNYLGELNNGKTFKKVAKMFEKEYEATTKGHRSPKWVQGHKDRLRLHLIPFFGSIDIKDINSGTVQDYRAYRFTKPQDCNEEEVGKLWKPPARKTIHNEIVTLNLTLKTALRHGFISQVPDLSDPYRRQTKVSHRPWFTPKEYKQLYTATRKNASKPKHPRYKWYAEQLHDFILFMANTGLRPDEANRLEFRDVEIVSDEWSGEKILEIEVRGKRGIGFCKSMTGAVRPFERLRDRKRSSDEGDVSTKSNDLLFPNEFKKMFNNLLLENDLKFDRDGKPRTAYSLRHSYICFRLLEGADIYQIAKNCRTSVEMIEKHYVAHLKDMLDTSLINVRKPRQKPID
jgi:integrase